MTLLATNLLTDTMKDIMLFGGIIVAIAVYIVFQRARNAMREKGIPSRPAHVNYTEVLLTMIAAAAGAAYFINYSIEEKITIVPVMLFVVLPYLAIGIFLVGSIYRYRNRGFQVSSLSSQFLERKRLFWGSQPFHWSLLLIFFGHLTAFLFPRAILAWNGEPVRLLILEITGFAAGVAAIIGLILLIRRRLSSDKVHMVTNKMDMLVYTTLMVQILSGLGIAFFERWGSSWFASVLTPYLRSIFALDPDGAAMAEMPFFVQLHVFSAFFIIAIIPFTRFMHFLVAPIDYLWRRYQLVVWNYSRKSIRNSRVWQYGKRSSNN